MSAPLVAILMGSKNDASLMEPTEQILAELGIPSETHVMSAHRTPDKVRDFARGAIDAGFEVIICAAGGAAHLPGAVAAQTTLPVIGVPLATSDVAGGQDAIYGVLQMPPGCRWRGSQSGPGAPATGPTSPSRSSPSATTTSAPPTPPSGKSSRARHDSRELLHGLLGAASLIPVRTCP